MAWQNKKVTVMGLGLHGGALGNIEWLVSQGAIVTATDLKSEDELKATVEKMRRKGLLTEAPSPSAADGDSPSGRGRKKYPVKLVLGEHRVEDFTGADMVLRNPAVPRDSEFIRLARETGVPVEMDSSLFFENCLSREIIGVTGSKGKTTTSNAIAVLLKSKWPQTVAVGIDGVSPLLELPKIKEAAPVIFELSSWRLEVLDEKKLGPKVVVITSIFRDHLNTYESFENYIEVKKSILKHQRSDSLAIFNRDDEKIRDWGGLVQGKLYWYTLSDLPDEQGIFVRDGRVMIRDDASSPAKFLFDLKDLPLESEHERRNLLPGILIACLQGMSVNEVKAGLELITRLPHRLEEARVIDGVVYINDSAATMPDAAMAALESFREQIIVHIVGGSDKNLLFEGLARKEKEMGERIRALVWLPGTATERMKESFRRAGVETKSEDAASMQEAVEKAKALAKSGDIVLLSPGATSFGLFQHEFDRGDQFREAVNKLSSIY